MKLFLPGVILSALLLHGGIDPKSEPKSQYRTVGKQHPIRAKYLITTADDFIVDLYLNGKPVSLSKRNLLVERFGATVEKVDIEVHKGDWLVFNVVNNRLRWNGNYYFAVAGCFAENEFGFTSQMEKQDVVNLGVENHEDQKKETRWSVCDSTRDISRFISSKNYFSDHKPKTVSSVWGDGDLLMRQYAGTNWAGQPIWGDSRNTWIKAIIE